MALLPNTTLTVLRGHRASHRNPKVLLPAVKPGIDAIQKARTHLNEGSAQNALQQARKAADIHRPGVRAHVLRHSYAARLLEAGVDVRTIQRHMGRAHLETTMMYPHSTQKGQEDACVRIDRIMEEAIKRASSMKFSGSTPVSTRTGLETPSRQTVEKSLTPSSTVKRMSTGMPHIVAKNAVERTCSSEAAATVIVRAVGMEKPFGGCKDNWPGNCREIIL